MDANPFADLDGDFEVAELGEGQLDDAGSIQTDISEHQLRSMHWRLSFKRVQYGLLYHEPVCLVIFEAKFHAEERKRHRFTWARISVDFEGEQSPVEVLKLAPERAYGIHVPEERVSQWTLSSNISVTLPGIPVTIELLSLQSQRSRKYPIDHTAGMQGGKRGFPKAKEVLWTLEEAMQEGIPWRIPSMIVLLKCSPGATFSGKFNVQAKVNASMNPLSWRLLKGATNTVTFDGKTELIPYGAELNRDFTSVDISALTKLDFADDI